MANYSKAVENIVKNCLVVKPEDRVIIVTDQDRIDIGQAIFEGASQVAPAKLLVIEDFVSRPAKEFPIKMQEEIKEFAPTVSIYAATGKPGELPVFRAPLRDLLVSELQCRHAHMIGIDSKLMEDGMSKDYAQIQKTISKLKPIVESAREITVTDPYGTNLQVSFSSELRWKVCDGLLTKPGDWSNLPDGEIFTCPIDANGKVVAWVIGDHFSDDYGVLQEPLIVTIKDSCVVSVESKNEKLAKEFETYISEHENGKKMGEFAIGALLGLEKFCGNLLQDEKFPGVHMAFGHPYPEDTGVKWDCPSHVDIIPKEVDVDVDGKPLLRGGKFVIDLN